MIIATAGHIDHGKTSLVRALTGVDTDRLEQEKARGMTIEAGYAYLPLSDGRVLGFIDVPGHERLVHAMAAGASGVDFALLVVAADDGVMPQTREHLAILELLGIRRGALVISKTDRVEPAAIEQVKVQLNALTKNTFLADAPMFAVSTVDAAQTGLASLRHHLDSQFVFNESSQQQQQLFRLAIDRVFSLAGHGTVVTGTVHAGATTLGQSASLCLMPANIPLRLRRIHAQNQDSDTAAVGQRCALNLVGVAVDDIKRGDWVADSRCFLPARHVDTQLRVLSTAKVLRMGATVTVHLAAARHRAYLVPLASQQLEPNQTALVQLVFDKPIAAMTGDRFIIRDEGGLATLGGGVVLDPDAPDRKRRSPARLAWLKGLQAFLAGQGVDELLQQAPYGLNELALFRLAGLKNTQQPPASKALWLETSPNRTLIAQQQWLQLGEQALQVLANFHKAAPDEPGVDALRWRRMTAPKVPEQLWLACLRDLQKQQKITSNGAWWHLPQHKVVLSEQEQIVADQLLPLLEAGGFNPPWVRDLAATTGVAEDVVRDVLRKLLKQGDVYQVVRDLYYHETQLLKLVRLFRQLAHPNGVKAATYRNATGLGRKRAIQLLEYFGRVGCARRINDFHLIRADSALFNETPPNHTKRFSQHPVEQQEALQR